jgi:hypothetical protein
LKSYLYNLDLGIKGNMYIVIKFKKINVIRFLSKMFFEEEIDCCFKHEGIINSDSAYVLLSL